MAGDPLSTSITASLKRQKSLDFPRKGYASVGMGTFPSMVPAQEMNQRFNQWAEEKGIDLSKAKWRKHPIYVGYHGFKHGNIFLTGDAASFACSADGEGIYA